MSSINNANPTTPSQSIRKLPIFEKPDTYLSDSPYLAEIVEAELRLVENDYRDLRNLKARTVKPKEEHYRLFVAFSTEDGQRFTKLFSEIMNVRWPFEAWLDSLIKDEAIANNYPDGLVGLKVRFVIKNENGFSNFTFFESVDEDNE